jgi:hypothetical protein
VKFLRFKLSSKKDGAGVLQAKIYCVLEWLTSPFVKINPDRVALIGRDLLLALKPQVLLDFEKRQTEIWVAGQARSKIKKHKKRAHRPRQRR